MDFVNLTPAHSIMVEAAIRRINDRANRYSIENINDLKETSPARFGQVLRLILKGCMGQAERIIAGGIIFKNRNNMVECNKKIIELTAKIGWHVSDYTFESAWLSWSGVHVAELYTTVDEEIQLFIDGNSSDG